MPKRKFTGNPIDATMSYLKEKKGGKTVGGTTDDDKGEEVTVALPNFIDKDEHEQWQLDKFEQRILHPKLSLKELCERNNWDYTSSSTLFADFRRQYKSELKNHDLYQVFEHKAGKEQSDTTEDVARDDARERIREYYRAHPDATVDDVVENVNVGPLNRQAVGSIKGNMVQHGKLDNGDDSKDGEIGELEERVSELESMWSDLTDGINELADQNSSNPPLRDVLGADDLYALVNGEALDETTRKELFEVLVSDE